MRKTLKVTAIAAAAAAAFGINSQAMAEVKVYGKAHLSVASVSGVGAADDGLQVASHASRVGFKAKSDLGDGMTGFVKMEYEIDMNSGAGIAKNRTNIAGLKGGFGTVSLGTADMPHKKAMGKAEMWGDTYGDFNGIIGPDTRQAGAIFYNNKFGDVGIALAYAPNYEATTNSNMGAAVDFKAGPVNVAIAYENDDADANATTGVRVSGSFGGADLHFVYNSEGGATANTQYHLAGKMKMGDGMAFKAQYGKDDTAALDMFAVGLDKKLGKKTSIYGLYASGDLKQGNDSSAIALGIVSKF